MISQELMEKAEARCLELVNEKKEEEVCKFKAGDKLRVLVAESLGRSKKLKIGHVGKFTRADTWLGAPCVLVDGYAYRKDQVELVIENLCSEIPAAPHPLDRAIAEQKKFRQELDEITATIATENEKILAREHYLNNLPFKTKETVMLKIETKTYVDGREIAKLTADDLVTIIAQAEAEIEKLNKLKNQPKKVKDKIAELEAGLAALIEHADKA